MTKEEIQKNSEHWYNKYKDAEKQIAELGKRCLQLQKDKGNLTDRVRELEAQIEKMKQERSAEVRQQAINEIVSAIEKDREEGR